MSHNILLVPIGSRVGLSTVSLGLVRALERLNVRVNFFKPISQLPSDEKKLDPSIAYLNQHTHLNPLLPFKLSYSEHLIGQGKLEQLLEELIEKTSEHYKDSSVLIMEGLAPTENVPWANRVNFEIARAMQADIVFVTCPGSGGDAELREKVDIYYNNQGGEQNTHLIGVVVNKVGAPLDDNSQNRANEFVFPSSATAKSYIQNQVESLCNVFSSSHIPLLGCISWNPELSNPRVVDIATGLDASFIHKGDSELRRLKGIVLCDHSVGDTLEQLKPGFLVVTSADRVDVIIAACLAVMNGVELGAILLTSGQKPSSLLLEFCMPALQKGLPLLLVKTDSWQTAIKLQNLDLDFPVDDQQHANAIQDFAASAFNEAWVRTLIKNNVDEHLLSPPAFRYKLTQLAVKAQKTIVLPEGDEPRTLKAAVICAQKKIARIILLGCPGKIAAAAKHLGISLGENIAIWDPNDYIEKYVPVLVELRRHKGMTEVVAREQLLDNVMLATVMLHQGVVDGLVSGAIHTTANTIRPALQIIKTSPGNSLVSSIFFMLLPDQVVIYGDCAINPNPNAEQLAEIAIQSAHSAKAFGLEPRVALISYSTGDSGTGVDVNKVREATNLIRRKSPDLIVDGPLQYDAAVAAVVAKAKAPLSPVAGHATVLIFPDLNTGNTTYKAVQRSAGLISIGPMLQGLNKPVNDLSRGALVEDIVYTIAITAIQAAQQAEEQI